MLTEFREVSTVQWVEAMNREILVAVKVESVTGIENIEEIAAVPGLDAILIGPGDLSASYEVPGQTNHPIVRAAVDRMLAACKRHGIAGGPHVSSAAAAREWADRGATFMSCSFDGALLLEASKQLAGGIHDLLGDRLQ
jgi:2-keto-3-deoxy-L-rhamnonate aldolase RhmA